LSRAARDNRGRGRAGDRGRRRTEIGERRPDEHLGAHRRPPGFVRVDCKSSGPRGARELTGDGRYSNQRLALDGRPAG